MKYLSPLGALMCFLMFSPILNHVYSQNKTFREIETNYLDFYNLDRETLFLHLNKTSLLPEENLWFAAYAYNSQKALPSSETVNLKLDIFDSTGKFLESQTVFMSNGKGFGFLELDPQKFQPGNYFLKASTNFMKNFEEDLSYVQAFSILDQNLIKQESTNTKYDLQLLPEGGHLLK